MGVEISIIVPVYNLEHLLPRCVDSILGQTFPHFELILVNDGSLDHSGDICEDYAKQDSRVKVVHKENGGVASSRNAGLEVAKGTYIGFVDNDDYIHSSMFELLYETATTHAADIVVCDFLKVYEGDQYEQQTSSLDHKIQHFNSIEASHQLFTDNRVTFVCPWNKLYKRTLFENIRFEHGSMNDDETVAHQLYYISKKITYIQTALYYYVQRKGSQTSAFSLKRFDAVYALKGRVDFYKHKQERILHEKALLLYVEKFFWYYYLAKSSLDNIEKELKELKRTFDKSFISLLKHTQIGWKQKVMFVLFRIHPSIYELIKNKQSKERLKVS